MRPMLPSRRDAAEVGRLRVRLPGVRRPVHAGGRARSDGRQRPLAPKAPHFPARAKRVIFLCMDGGPSHVDTFDYKPKLDGRRRQADRRGRGSPAAKLLGSPWKFAQHGQCGLWISRAVPRGRQARRRPVPRSTACTPTCRTTRRRSCRCTPAASSSRGRRSGPGRCTAWAPRTTNLPGFVTINPPANNGGPANYGSAFLPAVYQGTPDRRQRAGPVARAPTVSNIKNPRQSTDGPAAAARPRAVAQPRRAGARAGQPGDRGGDRVVRAGVPHAGRAAEADGPRRASRRRRRASTASATQATDDFGRQCLLARRFVEAGRAVRRGHATAAGTSTAT